MRKVFEMWRVFGWATVLFTFFAAPAFAQGQLCGDGGHGGTNDQTCEGKTITVATKTNGLVLTMKEAGQPANLSHPVTMTIISDDPYLVGSWTQTVMVPTTVTIWIDPVTTQVVAHPTVGLDLTAGLDVGDLRFGDQFAADEDEANQQAEAEAEDAARREEERACAGVPHSLRFALCPALL